MFCLFGCKEELSKVYSYCAVDQVERSVIHDQYGWIAHCDHGGTVVFPRRVAVGEEIYYTPYWVDDDSVTTFGYIKEIHEPATR